MIKRLSEDGWAPSCHGDTSSSNPLDIKLFIAMIQNWCFDIYLFILHFIYWYCSKYDISQICHICQLLTLKSLFFLNGKMFNLPTFYLTPRQRPVCTCGVWSLCLWAVYNPSWGYVILTVGMEQWLDMKNVITCSNKIVKLKMSVTFLMINNYCCPSKLVCNSQLSDLAITI